MSSIAYVNPDGLKIISGKIGGLSQDLGNLSKQMIQKKDNLYQSGFKDKKFSELKSRIEESQDDMKNLQNFMDQFQNYIQQQEKLIRKFLDSPQMKSGRL